MNSAFRLAPGGRARLAVLDHVLDEAYGAPEAMLGNQADPLDETIYVILSFQTGVDRFKETWQCLRSVFRRWEDAEHASVGQIAGVLTPAGLHRQKARAIERLLRTVRQTFGELSLNALRSMSDSDAERALTRLPGLSWKGARCVLLYSLDRAVFPIDGNTFRVFQRTGVIPQSAVYRRRSLHNAVQEAIPPERRRRFHVNLVIHGQRTCRSLGPKCASCPAIKCCARRNLPALAYTSSRPGTRPPGHVDPAARRRAAPHGRTGDSTCG